MKVPFFVKQFRAFVTGDDAKVRELKQFRKAQNSLKTQISVLEGESIAKEDALEEAEEGVAAARANNGNDITDGVIYVENLLSAKNKVTAAKEALKKHNEKLAFLKGELSTLEEEVEIEA